MSFCQLKSWIVVVSPWWSPQKYRFARNDGRGVSWRLLRSARNDGGGCPSDCFASLAMTGGVSWRLLRLARNDGRGVSRRLLRFARNDEWGVSSASASCLSKVFSVSASRGPLLAGIARSIPYRPRTVCLLGALRTRLLVDAARPFSSCLRKVPPFSPLRNLSSWSLRDFSLFVFARGFPFRHCEARSAEAISGFDLVQLYEKRKGSKYLPSPRSERSTIKPAIRRSPHELSIP